MTQAETNQLITLLDKYTQERLNDLRVMYHDPTINKNSDDLSDLDDVLWYAFELLEELK